MPPGLEPRGTIDPHALLILGVLLSLGLFADQPVRRTHIARVSLLLICGLVAKTIGLLHERMAELTDTVTITAP